MSLHPIDWLIVLGCLVALTWFSLRTARYMQGVADFLAGNRSAAITARRRALNRAFGSSLGSPTASVHPTIIDHNEIDRQLLGGTPKEFLASKSKSKTDGGKEAKSKHKAIDPNEEGKALVRYARKQYREGKDSAAFDTYRMAIEVLSGNLRELAKVEFRRVFGSAADQSLRMASTRR